MKSYNILVDKPTMLEGSTQVTATSWEIRSTPDTESKTNLIHHSYKNATNLFQYRINLDLTDEDVIYVRTKFHFGDRESRWSNPVSIKGEQKGYKLSNLIVGTPIVSYEFDLKTDKVNQLVLKASDMLLFTGYGNHKSTSWVIKNSDGKVVYERLEDTDNLKELRLSLDTIDLTKAYIVMAKLHTDTNGESRWGKVLLAESHKQGSLFDMRLLSRPTVGRTCSAEVILKTTNFATSSLRMVSNTGAILAETIDQPTLYPSFPIARLEDGTIDITNGSQPLIVEAGQDIRVDNVNKYDYIIVAKGGKLRYMDEANTLRVVNGYAFIASKSSSKRPVDLETPGFDGIYVLNKVNLTMDSKATPVDAAIGSSTLDRRPNGQTLIVEAGEIKTIPNPTAYDTILVQRGGRVQWQNEDGSVTKIEGYSYIVGRNITRTPSYVEDAGYDNVYVVDNSTLTVSNVAATEDYQTANNLGNVGDNVKIYGRIKLKDGTTTDWKLIYFGNIQDIAIMNLDANTNYLGQYSYSGEINLNGYTVQVSRELSNTDVLYTKYGTRLVYRGKVYNNRIVESGTALELPPEFEYKIPYLNVIPTYSDVLILNFAVFNKDHYKSSVWAKYILQPDTNTYIYDRHVIRDNELYSTAVNSSAVACSNGFVYYVPTRMRDETNLAIYKLNIETLEIIKEDDLPYVAKRDVSLCMLPNSEEFMMFGGNMDTTKRVGNEDVYFRENNNIYTYNVTSRVIGKAGTTNIISNLLYSFHSVLRKDGKVVIFNASNQGTGIQNQATYVYDPTNHTLVREDNDLVDDHIFRNTFAFQDGDILRVASKEFNSMPCYDYISNTLNVTQVDYPSKIERVIKNLKVNTGENIVLENPTRYGFISIEHGGSVTLQNNDEGDNVLHGHSLIITSNIDTPISDLGIENYETVYVIDDRTLTILEAKGSTPAAPNTPTEEKPQTENTENVAPEKGQGNA